MQLSSSIILPSRVLFLGLAALFCLLLTFLYVRHPNTSTILLSKIRHDYSYTSKRIQDSRLSHLKEISQWQKPPGLKVIGLVFYGRKRYVEILDCYLRRNLVKHGGILDKIVFAAKTDNEDDLNYLDSLLADEPLYSAEYHHEKGINFSNMYGACAEKGVICVKIDDDVLFIEDSTIPSIVKKKLEHSEYLGVSANLVVNFATAWIHWHLGAVHPFLPEINGPTNENISDWRPSTLPAWNGPEAFDWKASEKLLTATPGHRWLPLPPNHPLTLKTPISGAETTLSPNGWHNWLLATQQHYSLFSNLESNSLWKYNFETWNAMYERVSINLFAFSGEDLIEMGGMPAADEQHWTMDYPRKTGRAFVVDGLGIASHFGYASMQKKGEEDWRIEGTRVLEMYKRYAEEMVCGKR